MIEDDKYIVRGFPALRPIPDVPVGRLIYDQLLTNCTNNEALADALTGQSISYKTLLSKTCSLAESLRRSGCNENTVISICSENCIEFFIPVISAMYMGAIIAPFNHNYTKSEMIHALEISKPQIIFCSKLLSSKFVDLKTQLDFIEKIIILDSEDDFEGLESMDTFVKRRLQTENSLYRFDFPDMQIDTQVAFILYSSGTTGLPKGVMITQRNILVKFLHTDDPRVNFRDTSSCSFGFLPFFHAYGLFVCLASIYRGIKIVVMRKFEEKLFLGTIEKYRISSLALVPPLAVFLAKSPLVNAYDLSSVKNVGCGAAPLSKDSEEMLKKRLKINSIRQGYGLTEVTLSVTAMPVGEERPGSSGKVLSYMLCKVRDPETGKSLGPNQVGELCFKGPLVMKGYYGNAEATRDSFTSDGWLLTGDLGYYDKEEYFYIVGRLKELIKYKGFQVAPAELEAILLTNPKIKDAAVLGIPNEEAGELPFGFIVPSSNDALTEEEVQKFLASRVSPHKRLRGGVLFVPEIPKNASGKILRRQLQTILSKLIRSKL